ncbi:MAG TPA: potassium transporter Kup [Xanthobacteraceae bacterium]|jgi:KUP system potassium uptake protein|nr:potassium transporter Kup [Xanthobacteraceae bacterium]
MTDSLSASAPGSEMPATGTRDARAHAGFWGLTLGSIGVVYGDIGTSPLYALRESVLAAGGTADGVARDIVLGVLSLMLWALIIVVTLKYVVILLRADNNGEGGTLTLMALALRAVGRVDRAVGWVALLGITSAGLFYGDAVITPALSVLSAVEGIDVATPAFHEYVVPLTVVILVALFTVQSRGTAKVGALFGPITTIWFIAIASVGIWHIASDPSILLAFNPVYGIEFLTGHGVIGLFTLGAVFLTVTGAEALYADLGHFGRKPIQTAWFGFVLPSLVANYLGQGVLVLADPKTIQNPFFLLYPSWALIPMVILATAATVIASQAVITGAYSLTSQAIQLGLMPRLEVRHTSAHQVGQIYMPRVNGLLLIGVLLLVVTFRSSSAMASAYGIAVTGTMVVTGMMAFIVMWKLWRWSIVAAAALMLPFLLVDLTFLSANMLKVVEGGWVPLAIGGLVMLVMYTWRRGSRLLFSKTRRLETPLDDLVRILEKKPPQRVPGTAVFLTSDPKSAPTALLHSLKHYKVLHEKNVILSVETTHTPRVDNDKRVRIEPVGSTFLRVLLRFGYMETPNIPRALAIARKLGWQFDIMSTSFFLSRRTLRPATHSGMPRWQDRLFIGLARSANDATDYFQIPTDRVVEVGTQVTV